VDTWIRSARNCESLGDGRAAQRIVKIIEEKLASKSTGKIVQGLLF